MTNGLRATNDLVAADAWKLAVKLDTLLFGECLLLLFQLECDVEQSGGFTLVRHREFQECQVIPEEKDRLRIDDLFIDAHLLLPEDRRHRRDVFVTEPDVCAHKTFVAGTDVRNADRVIGKIGHPMPCQDLLGKGHRASGRRNRGHTHRALAPCNVVLEQSAVLDNAAGDLSLAIREDTQRNLFAAAHSIDETKIRARENAQVLTILPIDALDVFRDDQLYPGTPLGVWRLLARRTLTTPLPAHRAHKSTRLDASPLDRKLVTTLQS